METYEPADSSSMAALDALRDPLGVLRRRWRAALIATLIGFVATAGATIWMPRKFEAVATVKLGTQAVPEEFVRSTVDTNPFAQVDELITESLSQTNLLRVVDVYDLMDGSGVSSRDELAARIRSGVSFDLDFSGGGRRAPPVVSLRIAHQDPSPQRAAIVANALASSVVDLGIAKRGAQSHLTTEFMRRELRDAEAELRDQNREIARFRQDQMGELPSEMQSNLIRLEQLRTRRHELIQLIADASTRLAAGQVEDAAVGETDELMALRAELAQLLAVLTEDHPSVAALRDQIDIMAGASGQAQTGNPRAILIQSIQRELTQFEQELAHTNGEIKTLEQRVRRIPENAEKLMALEERAAVLREQYLEFLRNVKESELAESLERAQQGAQIKVAERARVPAKPKLARRVVAAAGAAASLVLGLLAAAAFEFLDPVLASASSLENVGARPVLGVVPRIV